MAIVGSMIAGSLLGGIANIGSSYVGGLAQERIERDRNEANLKIAELQRQGDESVAASRAASMNYASRMQYLESARQNANMTRLRDQEMKMTFMNTAANANRLATENALMVSREQFKRQLSSAIMNGSKLPSVKDSELGRFMQYQTGVVDKTRHMMNSSVASVYNTPVLEKTRIGL